MASSSKKSAAKANLLGKRKPEDDLETTPILKKHKEKSEEKETTKGFADSLQRVNLLETKSDQANLISVKEAAKRKKTLFVSRLPPRTKISDIIDFFKNVGEVVGVHLIVDKRCRPMRCGFAEFASSNQAKKALEKNNGEYLLDHKIVLEMAESKYDPRPKYSIYHKVWYKEDYLPVKDDETPISEVVFIANLSPQTKIKNVFRFFRHVGEVVNVRLIVNQEGKHVGYGFVEFASSYEAKKALKKNGEYLHDHKIFLDVAKTAPYPTRPKYNLAEMLCYEDYLRRESLLLEEDEAVASRKNTLSVGHLSPQTEISHIINFFKDVGEVVHIRLIVDHNCKHVGYGFVEFASYNEATKALEKKNGEYLHDHKIVLDVPKTTPCPPVTKYCIDHMVWYEDYLRRESLLIEEGEAVEGLVEEVAVRKKTLFVHNTCHSRVTTLVKFFKDVGEVVGVRFIVNHEGQHVGCCFVEFASSNEATKALQKKNGEKLCGRPIFLDEVEIAPYPLRPKYNLAEKLWYKDYIGRESLLIEEDDLETKPNMKKQKATVVYCGKKINFSDDD